MHMMLRDRFLLSAYYAYPLSHVVARDRLYKFHLPEACTHRENRAASSSPNQPNFLSHLCHALKIFWKQKNWSGRRHIRKIDIWRTNSLYPRFSFHHSVGPYLNQLQISPNFEDIPMVHWPTLWRQNISKKNRVACQNGTRGPAPYTLQFLFSYIARYITYAGSPGQLWPRVSKFSTWPLSIWLMLL